MQNLCVIIQLEPTVQKTVEPVVMGEVRSHWLKSMLESKYSYITLECRLFYIPFEEGI